MGGQYQEMQVGGDKQRKEVETIFADAQHQDRHENGHSYSGGFGMADGLAFPDKTFDTEAEAHEWLMDNCIKWEAAKCVTFLDGDRKATWLIGAWCSS